MRFVIANRRAGKADASERKLARADFDTKVSRTIASSFDILGDSATSDPREDSRRTILFDGDPQELMAKRKEFGADTIIEPERPRATLQYRIADYLSAVPVKSELAFASTLANPFMPAGTSETFEAKITGNGTPVSHVTLTLVLTSNSGSQTIREDAITDDAGHVVLQYDLSGWKPTLAIIEPASGLWPIVISSPTSGLEINMPPLPRTGPFGWWQWLVGSSDYSETRGAGIRVGVIDTGFGPHPYLAHVTGVGAFIDGKVTRSPEATRDSMNHGTHVTGTIGARPRAGSGDFGGIAPGVDLFVARVFEPGKVSNQGDISNAIDELSDSRQVDLINMSLGGTRSELEQDAIGAAMERGTLCVCAAGNNFGGHVLFPAGYPQCVAISALGILNVMPVGSASYANIPIGTDKIHPDGLFVAKFSNIGPEITCIAPGNAIISTVPAVNSDSVPYLAMDGTSMASPVATGTLAAVLSTDAQYKALPRGHARAAYADAALRRKACSLGFDGLYQGLGLIRM